MLEDLLRVWHVLKKSVLRRKIVLLVLVGLAVFLLSTKIVHLNLHTSVGFLALVGFLAIFAVDMIFRQSPQADEMFERVVDSLIDVFVALGIGFAMISLIVKMDGGNVQDGGNVKINGGNVKIDGENTDALVEFPKVIAVAVAAFGMGLVARSSRVVRDLEEKMETHTGKFGLISKELKSSTSEAVNALTNSGYLDIAARALGVKNKWLTADGEPHRLLPQSVPPGLDAIEAWIRAGGSEREWDKHQRDVWWRTMQIYFQEEVFDVSRHEVATNVRNYAFIVLAAVSEYLTKCAVDDIVVVTQVTPFAPKDFFNYPNGTHGHRFYHEPEFFGTYRRVLSAMLRAPKVRACRVLLAAPESATLEAPRTLGWSLEPINKLVLDTARYGFVKVPLTIPKDRSGEVFDPLHDPGKRLPANVTRILWNPTFVTRKNVDYTDHSEYWSGVDKVYKAAFNANRELQESMRRNWAAGIVKQPEYSILNALLAEFDPTTAERAALDAVYKATLARVPMDTESRRLAEDYLRGDGSAEPALRKALGSAGIDEAHELLRQIERLRLLQLKADSASLVDAEGVASLLRQSQALDGLLHTPVDGNRLHGSVSSTGVELGVVEEWLYRKLIALEAAELSLSNITAHSYTPLWRLLANELCGRDDIKMFGDLPKLNRNLRVCTVPSSSDAERPAGTLESHPTSVETMGKHNVAPEWIMIGYAKKLEEESENDDLPVTDRNILIRAEMSEPFHTCRMSFHFDDETQQQYREWLAEVWNDSREATNKFLQDVIREVRSAT